MSEQLTPHEHDEMRDLLLAGTKRMRPASSRRVRISTGVAVLLVAGAVGAVITTALNIAPRSDAPVAAEPTPTIIEPDPTTSDPGPAVPHPDSTEIDPGEVMPETTTVKPPARGTHLTLQSVPIYDDRLILGTGAALDAQGIDTRSAQGFQSVGLIHPWIADLKNGKGQCILIRKSYGSGGWSEIVCDENGVPASVEREVDGDVLLFTIVHDGVQVFNVPG